jgi:holo-[acyl-carrier protein] synthase
MIDGIGIDVVDIARFAESLERTPSLREKLFTPAEATKPILHSPHALPLKKR